MKIMMSDCFRIINVVWVLLTCIACSSDRRDTLSEPEGDGVIQGVQVFAGSADLKNRNISYSEEREPCSNFQPNRQALFGDLHVHSSLSFDAVAGRLDTRPAAAYDFAQGKSIPFFPQDEQGKPTSAIKIDRALDFFALSDHAEFLGERALCTSPNSPSYSDEFCNEYRKEEFHGTLMMASVISQENPKRIELLCGDNSELCLEQAKAPWDEIIEAAESAYDRTVACEFTSFVAYEYTGTPNDSNYHRNVIFRNNNVPQLPVTYLEAPKDYQLWELLDKDCSDANNCDYMSIPHNSNLSNGLLLTPYADLELSIENRIAYAKTRLRREPLMEIFQHKGGSECVNGLASVHGLADELCNVEQVRHLGEESKARSFYLEGTKLVFSETEMQVSKECVDGEKGKRGMFASGCISRNDFLRTALLTGLEERKSVGLNPVKLGVIASTDGHTATAGAVSEDDWSGTVSGEMEILDRLKPGTLPSGIKGNPGGLAGVWSEENSRDSIFNALQRRETFGTSGPRIKPRFFAGWNFANNLCEESDMIEQGYSLGVPMGGDLVPTNEIKAKPSFILAASRDPITDSTPLQQLQLVKGWVDETGQRHTKVQTVAGSKNNGSQVDLTTGQRIGSGHDYLCAVVSDDEFNPDEHSYYYLRVVENPSPRWSMHDCLGIQEAERPDSCADLSKHIIQEMAWSSPVWYTPKPKTNSQTRIEQADKETSD